MKKNILLLVCCFLLCLTANAQERNIILPEKPNRTNYTDYSNNDAGYWGALELSGGSMFDVGKRDLPETSFAVVNGFRFNEFLRIGIGLGVKYYVNNNDVRTNSQSWTFPLYADVRGNIVSQYSRTVVPYWSVDMGSEIRGGFFFSPTIGMRFGQKRSSFLLGLSYEYTQVNTYSKDNEGRNVMMLKLGYEF